MASTTEQIQSGLNSALHTAETTFNTVKDQITEAITESSKPTGPLAFKHVPNAQTEFKPPLLAPNAFLGDVISNDHIDPIKPLSCGFYRLEKGVPLVYEYTYHEMKIILDGHFYISDETGQKVKATKGDVFYFPKGATITFTTDDFGLAFYTGQRKEGGG